jgi:hypothetical protein
MQLEALAQPARMDAIQKQILIKFGGERYEGKIVCRNCGQALPPKMLRAFMGRAKPVYFGKRRSQSHNGLLAN